MLRWRVESTTDFHQGWKSMRFHFIDQAKKEFPVSRLCYLMGVSQSGYFAWKDQAVTHRQRYDLVMLAYVRSA